MLPLALLACAPPPVEGAAAPLGERYQVTLPPDAGVCDAEPGAVCLYEAGRASGVALDVAPAQERRLIGATYGVRGPWSLRLRLVPEEPDLDCRAWPDVIGRRYLVWSCHRELGGGSGGEEHAYEGWTKLADGEYLRFSFHDQAEWPSEGATGLLWSVIASVRRR